MPAKPKNPPADMPRLRALFVECEDNARYYAKNLQNNPIRCSPFHYPSGH